MRNSRRRGGSGDNLQLHFASSKCAEGVADRAADREKLRIDIHAPIFVEILPAFDSTQGFLSDILALHRAAPISGNPDVEAYTRGVLPERPTGDRMEAGVARELTGWEID